MTIAITENRTLLQKADLALSDLLTNGGALQPAQAQKFMRLLIDESVILQQATVVPMRAPKQLIEKTRFGSRVLRAGNENTALGAADRTKPDLGKVELDAQLFKAEVRLDNEVLEDNIEGGNFKQTVMQMLSEAISRDMDEVIVKGDTTSADSFLAKFDGMLKAATSNIVDCGTTAISRTHLKNMLKTMPSPFIRDKKALRFFTSIDAEIDYRDALGDRATIAGDKFTTEDAPVMYSGVPMVSVPLFPENLGGGTNETNIVLTDPKNLTVGIWRDIKIETAKDVSAGTFIVVATLRFDFKYAEETAAVKATKVKVGA
jgi:hypothetical protein